MKWFKSSAGRVGKTALHDAHVNQFYRWIESKPKQRQAYRKDYVSYVSKKYG